MPDSVSLPAPALPVPSIKKKKQSADLTRKFMSGACGVCTADSRPSTWIVTRFGAAFQSQIRMDHQGDVEHLVQVVSRGSPRCVVPGDPSYYGITIRSR